MAAGLAEPAGGGGRRGRHAALSARNAARRARSSGPAGLLRPRRSMVLDAVTVRNLELVEPMFAADAASGAAQRLLAVLDQTADRHGRASAAPAAAAPVAGPRARSKRGWTRWASCCAQTILRAELRKQLAGCSTSNGCSPKSAGHAPARAICWRWAARSRRFRRRAGWSARGRARACARIRDGSTSSTDVATRSWKRIADEPPVNVGRWRRPSAPASTRSSTSCATCSQNGKQLHRADRDARAAAHRHRVAEGPLQQRLRLLHRNLARQSAPGAGRLRAQADAGECGALHHAGAEGIRAQGAGRGGEDPRRSRRICSPTCGGARRARRSAFGRPRRRWRSWT